jgi:putative tryptophan/tyrosine transport system substrate-binding protein
MMKRRTFLTLLGGAAAAWPLAARAQHPALPVIGYLNSSTPINPNNLTAFRMGLSETDYAEGRNVAIELRAASQYDQLPDLAANLVRQRVSVIVASALPAALAAKMATTEIPIVFFTGSDPVKAGLVTSFSRPTGNLTGVASLDLVLLPKRLELLRELIPTASVIAAIFNPTNPDMEARLKEAQETARGMNLELVVVQASTERDLIMAFDTIGAHRAAALLVSDDQFFVSRAEQLASLAMTHAIPTVSFSRTLVTAGGLISYSSAYAETFRQVGIYAGRLLKGERPADLPVVQPTKIELVLNLKTAKALGLTVPPSLLARADEVIE